MYANKLVTTRRANENKDTSRSQVMDSGSLFEAAPGLHATVTASLRLRYDSSTFSTVHNFYAFEEDSSLSS
eukprot:1140782-Pelagomonas_calceolata.AAC.1